ncbi:ribosomal RNA small subunit methyltransferase A [bacterium]|nr:ribosomal RNA small subunit methyltransferase A [bacterium]
MGEPRRRRHALGQHFLVDRGIAGRTVALAGLAAGTTVLEIGPGRGALTEVLLASGLRVVAIELDDDLAGRLEARALPGLDVLRGDALRLDDLPLPAGPLPVVANLPYSTGTAILSRLLRSPARFPRLVLMLQKEVAQRVCAGPGSRSYGSLSVLVALHAEARLAFDVPPRCFAPPPKVDSAVVRLDVLVAPRADVADEVLFRRVVRGAFSQRRKTLRNSLRGAFGEPVARLLLERSGIDPGRRAEELDLREFAGLARVAGALAEFSPGPGPGAAVDDLAGEDVAPLVEG